MSVIFVSTESLVSTVADLEEEHKILPKWNHHWHTKANTFPYDLGYVRPQETAQRSFRIANDGDHALDITYSTSLVDEDPYELNGGWLWQVTSGTLTLHTGTHRLDAGEIGGTTTLSLKGPVVAEKGTFDAVLYVHASDGETYEFPFYWSTVPPNQEWTEDMADIRRGTNADVFSEAINQLSQEYILGRFTPVPLQEEDPYTPRRVRLMMDGGNITGIRSPRNIELRLSPASEYGYTVQWCSIRASFQNEFTQTIDGWEPERGSAPYTTTATLYLPAWIQLVREWALFQHASHVTPQQWKRTVYTIKRLDKTYALDNIDVHEFAGDVVSYTADLTEIRLPTHADRSGYNPFAITYGPHYRSHKPVAVYPSWHGLQTLLEYEVENEDVHLSLPDPNIWVDPRIRSQ